jgi:DNA invertase Pin-like site-specific DNA recombinase
MKTFKQFLQDKRLSTRWVADKLGVSKMTVYNWINSGHVVIENGTNFYICDGSKVIKKCDIEV